MSPLKGKHNGCDASFKLNIVQNGNHCLCSAAYNDTSICGIHLSSYNCLNICFCSIVLGQCLVFAFCLQGSAEQLQCSYGLHNCYVDNVELRHRGHDMHPLEGSTALAAGIFNHDKCSDGAYLHQILARLDSVGRPSYDIYLG